MGEFRDTIFALSTAPGRAGVSVVRMSGPHSLEIAGKITKSPLPPARELSVRRIFDDDRLLDEAMVVWFAEGRSFTSEQVVELHLHGGQAIVSGVLKLLATFDEARPAGPGEFTRRALEGGRLDLVEAEALADLIDAETEEQRKQAMDLMVGAPGSVAHAWRENLVRALALIEASIDFADEEDAPSDVSDEVKGLLTQVRTEMEEALKRSETAERIRDGYRVALVGAPNAGKSTLLNAISRRQAAITSPLAGTTRDVIEVAADFQGFPVILQDMAGLRSAEDEVERLGVTLAEDTARAADLRLFLEAKDSPLHKGALKLGEAGDLRVFTKADKFQYDSGIVVSALDGTGLSRLIDEVVSRLKGTPSGSVAFGHRRQIDCLERCVRFLEGAETALEAEISVAELRGGIGSLNELFGSVSTEEVLGEVFSRFCIGK